MPVTASSFTLSGAQADGSRECREVHTITGGTTREYPYLGPANADNTAIMNARVPSVNVQIAEEEALANMERDGALTTLHQTAAQFAARFREEVRQATQSRACYLAWWLLRRIAAGQITDAQCQTAFGMTAAAWTTFKTNTVTPRSNAWAALIAAAGV